MRQSDYRAPALWRRRPTLETAAILYFAASAGQVLLTIATRALSLLFPGLGLSFSYINRALFQAGLLLLPALAHCAARPGMLQSIGLVAPRPLSLLLCALAGTTGVFLADSLGGLWLILLEALGAKLTFAPIPQGSALIAALFFSALLPALCEEFFFRGVVLSAFERQGSKSALIISALLFASLHGSIEGLPVHFVMGLSLGVCVMASGCLVSGMVFHLVYNLLTLFLSVGGPVQGSLLSQAGGLPGVGVMALRMGFYALILWGILFALWNFSPPRPTPAPAKKTEMAASTLVVLMGGVVTALCVYLIDILSLWGVLS